MEVPPPTDATSLRPPSPAPPKSPPAGAALTLMNLEDPHEASLLVAQRVQCGWYSDKVSLWASQMRLSEKRLFWVTLPPTSPILASLPPAPPRAPITREDEEVIPVGHIALDVTDRGYSIPQASLASEDGSVLSVSTLFVVPECAGKGLADFAMDTLERMATVPPFGFENCHTLTLNVIPKRYYELDEPSPAPARPEWENRGFWRMMGLPTPKGRWSTEGWYEKKGYRKYDEVVRVVLRNEETGWEHPIKASLMRKPAPGRTPPWLGDEASKNEDDASRRREDVPAS